MNDETIGPSQSGERIQSLDVVRGFALFGILLMNIEYFQRPLLAILFGLDTSQTGLDYAVAWFSYVFVQGKFYTMFSMLFGMGFVIFLDRAMARGVSARTLFVRRLAVLAAFGAAHAFLVWSGDILLAYAVVGFLLLLFTKTPAKRLWKWGVGIFVVPMLLLWLGAMGVQSALKGPGAEEMLADFDADRVAIVEGIDTGEAVYRDGTWPEAVRWRVREFATLYGGGGVFFFVPMILGLFLIGAAFGRSGLFRAPGAHRGYFRRMAVIGYLVGIPAAVTVGVFGGDMEVFVPTFETAALFTVQTLSNISLCLAYISTIVLLLTRTGGAGKLSRLAPMGRMALTNYITHSVVFTLVFYGYGLGLYGEIGRAGATGMALVLLGVQVWFSGWWLSRFRMGPLEWLWRCLTYGRLQPFRV